MKVPLVVGLFLCSQGFFGGAAPGAPPLQEEHKDEQHREAPGPGEIKLTDAQKVAGGIEIIQALRRSMPILVRTTGTVEANADRLAHVGSLVEGVVESVAEKGHLGVHVKPGDTLAVLHSVSMGEAQTGFLKSTELLNLAEKNYRREKSLFERKVTSGKEVLQAESEREQAGIEQQMAEARLRILGYPEEQIARLKTGEIKPDGRIRITAPIEGSIIGKHIVRGEFVGPQATLFIVADLHDLWVQSHIYERELARVGADQVAEVSVGAYPEVRFAGRVAYVCDMMDEQTRTVKARVVVLDESHRLKPGMFAQVHIRVGKRDGVTAVPEGAVQAFQGGSIVFVEEEPNHCEVRKVATGVRFGGWVEITDGLGEGEKVVMEGAFLLKSEMEKGSFHAGHGH